MTATMANWTAQSLAEQIGRILTKSRKSSDPYAGRPVKLFADLNDPHHRVSRDEIMEIDHQNADGTVCIKGDDHFIGNFDLDRLVFLD